MSDDIGAWSELPEVEDIKRITYNPDDTIALRLREHASVAMLDRLREQLAREFEGRRVVVLDAGATLDVLAPEDTNDTGVTLTPENAAWANLAAPSSNLADAWDAGFLVAHHMDYGYGPFDNRPMPDHLVEQIRYWNPHRPEFDSDPFGDDE